MYPLKGIYTLLILGLLLTSIVAFVYSQRKPRIREGVWGGAHINMNVRARSATIEYDCASGFIVGPLVVDEAGNFHLGGTHTAERGGPVRADDQPKEEPATYTGTIKGNTMTLTLKLADNDEETFTLEKGKPGKLFKCK